MLGKLIKYDMKALNRFLVLIHAFLLLAAICGRFFITSKIYFSAEEDTPFGISQFLLSLSLLLFVAVICAANFGTIIIIAIRFYKNLYSDEGYLTHTLPISKGIHLLSKTISGSIWFLIDSVLLLCSLWIVIFTPSLSAALNENKAEILDALGISNELTLGSFLAIGLIYLIICAISSVIMVYSAITCGQLFSNHRILGSVVCYLLIQTAISILSLFILAISGYFTERIFISSTSSDFGKIMSEAFTYSTVLIVITTVIMYIGTYWLMKKRTNL